MNERDAAVLHDLLARERLARVSGPEEQLAVRWQRFCDQRRHERRPRCACPVIADAASGAGRAARRPAGPACPVHGSAATP